MRWIQHNESIEYFKAIYQTNCGSGHQETYEKVFGNEVGLGIVIYPCATVLTQM